MKWDESFSAVEMPEMKQISEFIANPLWNDFCLHLETAYGVSPSLHYSSCSGAPGWNIKYRKSGRALCTLYPDEGFFTCLVTVGNREAEAAEILLPVLSDSVQKIYHNAKPMNGTRWLMIPIVTSQLMEDAKRLIEIRIQNKSK